MYSGTYEDHISNRTFDPGPAHTPQVLPTAFFNDSPIERTGALCSTEPAGG